MVREPVAPGHRATKGLASAQRKGEALAFPTTLAVSVQKMQPGKAQDYMVLYDKHTKPVLEQLYKDGALTGYGVDAELVHSGDPAFRFFWQMLPDADALDKVQAAFDAAREKRTPEERRAIGQSFAELTDATAHRDSRTNVIYYSVK